MSGTRKQEPSFGVKSHRAKGSRATLFAIVGGGFVLFGLGLALASSSSSDVQDRPNSKSTILEDPNCNALRVFSSDRLSEKKGQEDDLPKDLNPIPVRIQESMMSRWSPENSIVARCLEATRDGGAELFLLPETRELLLELEFAVAGGDRNRRKRIEARLARRLGEDPLVFESLLGLLGAWPRIHDAKDFYLSIVHLLVRVDDQECRARAYEVLLEREEALYASRMQDPAEISVLLGGNAAPEVKIEVLKLLLEKELSSPSVLRMVEELALRASQPRLRGQALRLLAQTAEEDFDPQVVFDALDHDEYLEVQRIAVEVLSVRIGPEISKRLVEVLETSVDVVAKRFAAQGLEFQETSPPVVRALLTALETESDRGILKNLLWSARAHSHNHDVGEVLLTVLRENPVPVLRSRAAFALAVAGSDVSAQALRWAAENDPEAEVRESAALGLEIRKQYLAEKG